MNKKSAGILAFRREGSARVCVFLVHPGGPFWEGKDAHSWSIPKGEFEDGEEPLKAARREFEEEIGRKIDGLFIELKPRKQPSGKMVFAWAIEQDIDAAAVRSNEFEMEWPPKSGVKQRFPEVDKAEWFELWAALRKVHKGQIPILEELAAKLAYAKPSEAEDERFDGGLFG